jgi:hypothetical protein
VVSSQLLWLGTTALRGYAAYSAVRCIQDRNGYNPATRCRLAEVDRTRVEGKETIRLT